VVSSDLRTFSQFLEAPESISTNILTDRLAKLKKYGLVCRTLGASNRNNAYRLTESGQDFEEVIYALGKWASKNLSESHTEMMNMPDNGNLDITNTNF
jgi:DNA-binding HxlR family transcriptional regulator